LDWKFIIKFKSDRMSYIYYKD